MAQVREHGWTTSIVTGLLAVIALVAGSEFGKLHAKALDPKIIAWASAAVLLASGVVAIRRVADGLGRLITLRSITSAGAAVRLLITGVGYVVVAFAVFGVLGVPIDHLLVGAGLAGIVLGIAAQQSLGNIFAALVLLLARPFKIGDHLRIRSGALGGVFEAWVLEISLTYVTLRTDDGPLKVPNSAMLAAGIGQLPDSDADPQLPGFQTGDPPPEDGEV
jgi:small-conductance mechanosensitive channel